MCYPQGDEFNTPLSRLLPDSDPLKVSLGLVFCVLCIVLVRVVVEVAWPCATRDDADKDNNVCTPTISSEINCPPHPDHLAYTLEVQDFET